MYLGRVGEVIDNARLGRARATTGMPIWAAAVILAVVVNWGWRLADAVPGWFWGQRDISVYVIAEENMRAGGDGLYDPPPDLSYTNALFVYPPASAAFTSLFYFRDRDWTVRLWLGVTIAFLVGTAMLAWCFKVPERRRWEWVAVGMFIACGPVWSNMWWGQINILLLAAVAAALVSAATNRPVLAGVFTALAAHLKILPGVLMIVFAVQRNYRAAIASAAAMVLWALLPLIFTVPAHGLIGGFAKNVDLHSQFLSRRIFANAADREEDPGMWDHPSNSSIPEACERVFGSRKGGLLVGAGLIALGLVAALRHKSPARRMASAGLVLFATQLANPATWPHHLCLLPVLTVPLYECSTGGLRKLGFVAHVAALQAAIAILWCWGEGYWTDATMKMMVAGVPTVLLVAAWFAGFFILLYQPPEEKLYGLGANESEATASSKSALSAG